MAVGVSFGNYTPIERELISMNFVRGWWTDKNDNPITEALFGETVKFHLETKNLNDGEVIAMTLYDDDKLIKPLEEDGKNDPKGLVYSANGQAVLEEKIFQNKIVKLITLNNFEDLLNDEKDGEIELFFECTYTHPNVSKVKETVNLPHSTKNYLRVKGLPKIIFVNGQWRLAKYSFGEMVGPTQPKKPYWYDVDKTLDNSKKYFGIFDKFEVRNQELTNKELENKNFVLYYDGSSYAGADQSGKDRFENGRKFAEENFEEITSGLAGNEIYFISHSEGGAYAAGMADYLYEKGITIGEHILLSPDEGDEFSINPKIPSYQLTYMFFSSVWNPTGTIINSEKAKIYNKGFRKWGKYYAIVDWVTNEFRVKGTQKMGIVRNDNLNWGTVHGSTNDMLIFNKVSDLKEVTYHESIGEVDGKAYSGIAQSSATNKTLFYRINDQYISVNCPPISKIK